MRYTISHNDGIGSPVWWIVEDGERVAGVHWGLHDGQSDKAQVFAQKIADGLNALEALGKPCQK